MKMNAKEAPMIAVRMRNVITQRAHLFAVVEMDSEGMEKFVKVSMEGYKCAFTILLGYKRNVLNYLLLLV